MLQGKMMNVPLVVTSIMHFAERNHPRREIVSVTSDQPHHRYNYAEAFRRARKLANALATSGLEPGDRVATLAWNDHRHFEIYYAVSCSGYVCHTINPRLFAAQVEYIIGHAEDRLVFIDPMFLPLIEPLQDKLGSIKQFVILTDAVHMPATQLRNAVSYEEWIAPASDSFDWPELDENAACSLCYTSGTTGNPKGVLFSHRSTVLHTYAISLPDVMGMGARECVMPLVPMFHVNAWGAPYAVPMAGAKLVLPGPKMADGESLQALIESEGVTYTLGVPTVWLALLQYLAESGKGVAGLKRICVGGAACPASVIDRFRDDYGVQVFHAWGMTEMSPVGTYNSPNADTLTLSPETRKAQELRQGRGIFGVEMKIVNDAGDDLPWDGATFGTLKVRGPWVCSGYFGLDEEVLDEGGWFNTGDVATIDPAGYMQITDRTKDVIKSGGEWISSIEIENTAVDHPSVQEAAVIGRAHPKWSERPLLLVVLVKGAVLSREDMLAWFAGKVARWWVPDDVIFVTELPHTATGKLKKTALREQYADYVFPDADGPVST